jgi:acetolactate synthase-1/2/3 large subunit
MQPPLASAVRLDGVLNDPYSPSVGWSVEVALPIEQPRTFLSPGYQDNLGGGFGPARGAKAAMPDRKVLALEGDGSAMYTVQSLWTMAREGLDITVLIFANRAYRILQGEYAGVGAGTPGPRATDMLSLDRPTIDWVGLARSMGVEAGRATDLGELARELSRGLASRGPYLVEAVL